MSNIIKAEDLPDGEKVYLKKDFLGWRVVEPVRNEDGSWNWKKIIVGTKRTWFGVIVILIIAALFYFGIKEILDPLRIIAENPGEYCASIAKGAAKKSISLLNFTGV